MIGSLSVLRHKFLASYVFIPIQKMVLNLIQNKKKHTQRERDRDVSNVSLTKLSLNSYRAEPPLFTFLFSPCVCVCICVCVLNVKMVKSASMSMRGLFTSMITVASSSLSIRSLGAHISMMSYDDKSLSLHFLVATLASAL